MSLLEMLSQQLGSDAVTKISGRLGTEPDATGKVVSAALPVLVGALAKNAASDDGASALASALDRDHDGSVLDDLGNYLGRTHGNSGQAILRHVLGGRQAGTENAIGQMSGLDPAKVAQILRMLAPVVMGALGQQKRRSGLSPGDLGTMLGQERRRVEKSAGVGDLFTQILDRDGDGSALDDVAGMLGGFFKRRR